MSKPVDDTKQIIPFGYDHEPLHNQNEKKHQTDFLATLNRYNTTSDYKDMEVFVELEDDLFFADLSKQISLLIMDEDEEDPLASSTAQSFSRAIHPPPQSAFIYEQLALRRSQIKGTGVFIPQSTQVPRRKHRKGRSTSFAKSQKQSQDTRMVSQISDKIMAEEDIQINSSA